MSVIERFFPADRRAAKLVLGHPAAGAESWFPWGMKTATGIAISPELALQCQAVYACVRVLAETIAALPLFLYRRLPGGGKEQATAHPLYSLVHGQPNPFQTSYEWREQLVGHACLRGNALSRVVRSETNGRVLGLYPLHPVRVRPVLEAGRLAYEHTPPSGPPERLLDEEVLHIRLLTLDGCWGLSPISQAREAIGLARALEDHGGRLFSNAARPGGFLKHPGKLGKDARENLRESFEARHQGLENAHRLAILEEGMDWQQVGLSSQDAQYLEQRKFQVTEIARLFRVPPHKIGDLERATFSNIEHQAIEFVTDTILPWVSRLEQRLTLTLLAEQEQGEFFFEFLLQGLLRGDQQTRYAAYHMARMDGWMNPNEIRLRENMNPIPEGGDTYWAPVNMQNAEAVMAPVQAPAPRAARAALPAVVRRGIERMARELAEKLANREADAIGPILEKRREPLKDLGEFWGKHQPYYEQLCAAYLGTARVFLACGRDPATDATDAAGYTAQHISTSRAQIMQALRREPPGARQAWLDQWRGTRADDIQVALLGLVGLTLEEDEHGNDMAA